MTIRKWFMIVAVLCIWLGMFRVPLVAMIPSLTVNATLMVKETRWEWALWPLCACGLVETKNIRGVVFDDSNFNPRKMSDGEKTSIILSFLISGVWTLVVSLGYIYVLLRISKVLLAFGNPRFQ